VSDNESSTSCACHGSARLADGDAADTGSMRRPVHSGASSSVRRPMGILSPPSPRRANLCVHVRSASDSMTAIGDALHRVRGSPRGCGGVRTGPDAVTAIGRTHTHTRGTQTHAEKRRMEMGALRWRSGCARNRRPARDSTVGRTTGTADTNHAAPTPDALPIVVASCCSPAMATAMRQR